MATTLETNMSQSQKASLTRNTTLTPAPVERSPGEAISYHRGRVTRAFGDAATAIVEAGRFLADAQQELGPLGLWDEFLSEHVRLSIRSARLLIQIGSHKPFANGNIVAALPNDQQALACLTRIPEQDLSEFVKCCRGSIQGMSRAQVKFAVNSWIQGHHELSSPAPKLARPQSRHRSQVKAATRAAERLARFLDEIIADLDVAQLSVEDSARLASNLAPVWNTILRLNQIAKILDEVPCDEAQDAIRADANQPF